MANDPNSMSQDDIDALINQASGAAPSPAPSQAATPAKVSAGPAGSLGQDDIDALINQVQASAPATKPVAAAPKSAASAGAMGQDDIDALINQVQASAPATKPVAAAPKPAAKPAAPSGSLGQDDIDALINQTQASAPPTKTVAAPKAAAPAGSLGQDDIDALINQTQASAPATKPVTAPKPAAPVGSLGQDDIDALINQVQASAPPTKTVAAPKPAPKPATPAGSLGQDDIDALINQTQASAPASAAKPAAKPAASATTLDQDAIDALINQVAPSPAPAAGSTKRTKRESISQVLDSVQNAANAKAQASPDANVSGPLGQDDIDKLLADLGAKTNTKAGTSKPAASDVPSVPTTAVAAHSQKPGTTTSNASAATIIAPMLGAPSSGPGPTLALSADDLDALVDRQVGVTSDHGEAPMIDQGDIDALVKQLANATGAPNTQKISEALAKHEGEIDRLLEQAGNGNATMDAVPLSALQVGSASMKGGATMTLGVPVMAPAELKGARWLLVAAVLFLAVCATTLGMVVQAINGLSSELKTQREAALTPSNSFANDYKAAVAQLGAQDATEMAKGVLFMGRLKARYPGHEAEIALALGRHFRAKGAFHQAAEEFSTLAETGHGLFDDPRIFLDYAACLTELGDMPAATRQVYRLLANEDRYLAPRDHNGLMRPGDEVVRNQQAVQDAYLTLGRMLGIASQQGHERATASKSAAANTSHGAAHETAHEANGASGGHAPAQATDHHTAAPAAAHDAHGGH